MIKQQGPLARPLFLYVLRFDEVSFAPLSLSVTNPVGRLVDSSGVINSRNAV